MSCHYFLLSGLLFAVLNDVTAVVTCGPGYKVSNFHCIDENECDVDEAENKICGENAVCFNTEGSYYCQCVIGFQSPSRAVNFTQEICEDINECTDNKTICGSNAKCSNVPGSYYCMCDSGFMASAGQRRFNAGQSVTCRDSESHEITVYYCMDVESSARQQKYNQTVLGLLVNLWILMFFQ